MSVTPKISTMEELARVCGIFRPTLSKYFNNPASVRKSTRKRIDDALERYNYTPNFFAINQNRRTTRNVGIVVPNLSDPFFSELGREAELACIFGLDEMEAAKCALPDMTTIPLHDSRDPD